MDIANGKTTTTLYVGNVEIIKHSDKSYTSYRRNVGGAIIEEATDGSQKTNYLHTDHLGSTDVITNASGSVVQQFSFNAFGERRDSVNWETYTSGGFLSLSPMTAALTLRGYTGHEQMDEVGLIHMNGRVYDPKLGRFIQADPHIQAPSDSQNLNRYSYVNNNPLSYTDPTGYFFKKLWDEIRPFVGAIVGIVLAVYCPPCSASIWGAMGAGAAAGAAGAAANGGNIFKGAVVGAFTAAITFGAGEIIQVNGVENIYGAGAIRGVAGGLSSVLSGGKFGHGFAAAGFSSMAGGKIDSYSKNTVTRGVMRSIVGGTASRISGGKFANGAVSSAISFTFNELAHEQKPTEAGTGYKIVNPEDMNKPGYVRLASPTRGEVMYVPRGAMDDGEITTRAHQSEGSLNASGQATSSYHAVVYGQSFERGFIADSSGNMCQIQVECTRIGPGVGVAAGTSFSASVSDDIHLREGEYNFFGLYTEGDVFAGGQLQLNFGASDITFGKAGYSAGLMATFGVQSCTATVSGCTR